MGDKICQWSALYEQFVFMLRLWDCRWSGRERWKAETVSEKCWKDFEAYGQLLDSENAFSRNSYKGSMMLRTCFVCAIAGNYVTLCVLISSSLPLSLSSSFCYFHAFAPSSPPLCNFILFYFIMCFSSFINTFHSQPGFCYLQLCGIGHARTRAHTRACMIFIAALHWLSLRCLIPCSRFLFKS
jgi:hypothetical protein